MSESNPIRRIKQWLVALRPGSPGRRSAWRDALAKQDLALLVGLFLFAACTFLFIELADALDARGETIDTRLLLALRNPNRLDEPLGPPWLSSAMREITALGSWPVVTLVMLFTLGLLLIQRRWRSALLVTLAVGGGAVLMTALKASFGRPRPSAVPHLVEVLSLSFPSGHATIAAVTYVTLGAMATQRARHRSVQIYLLAASVALALLVGVTRVYLGVHYPSDVLAGWCLGLAWASLCLVLTRLLRRFGVMARATDGSVNSSPQAHPPPRSGYPPASSKHHP